MSYVDDPDDQEEDEDHSEYGDDESLADAYDRNQTSARGVAEEEIFEATESFAGTPFVALIQNVAVLRKLFGPSDPTINDLLEEIQSELTVLNESIKANPVGFVFEVSKDAPKHLLVSRKVIDDLIKLYLPEEGGED